MRPLPGKLGKKFTYDCICPSWTIDNLIMVKAAYSHIPRKKQMKLKILL